MDGVRSFLEIKSGPNDLDAAQVKHYAEEIALVEQKGEKAFIGITYGKKESKTVSTGLLESYLPNWKEKTLIGKELWDFVAGSEGYHDLLTATVRNTAEALLATESLTEKVNRKIEELVETFKHRYDSMEDFHRSLW